MLVGVNALNIKPGYGGGEERFLRIVLSKMRQLQPSTKFAIFTDAGNHESFEGWDRVQVEPGSWLGGSSSGDVAAAAKRAAVDVLFSPLATAPAKCSTPLVLLAMDFRLWDNEFTPKPPRGVPPLKAVKKICAAAKSLVVPSVAVQRKALYLMETGLDKITVAPLGVDEVFSMPQPTIIDGPYYLVVGDTRSFKNIPRLQELFKQLSEETPHTLVVVGRPGDAEPANWGPRVIRVEQCPAAHLASLYQHSDVYIQPSLYEGSGVTILEAIRAGACIATSRVGGIEEVAGDVPVFFNPESVPSMLGAVRRILEEDRQKRRKRAQLASHLASEYTWEKCAWKTLTAFKKA